MTDNELIAEFMGLEIPLGVNEDGTSMEHPYDISWDWIIPVVDKIRMLCIQRSDLPREPFAAVTSSVITVSIEILHKRVVRFIKWYKSKEVKP